MPRGAATGTELPGFLLPLPPPRTEGQGGWGGPGPESEMSLPISSPNTTAQGGGDSAHPELSHRKIPPEGPRRGLGARLLPVLPPASAFQAGSSPTRAPLHRWDVPTTHPPRAPVSEPGARRAPITHVCSNPPGDGGLTTRRAASHGTVGNPSLLAQPSLQTAPLHPAPPLPALLSRVFSGGAPAPSHPCSQPPPQPLRSQSRQVPRTPAPHRPFPPAASGAEQTPQRPHRHQPGLHLTAQREPLGLGGSCRTSRLLSARARLLTCTHVHHARPTSSPWSRALLPPNAAPRPEV